MINEKSPSESLSIPFWILSLSLSLVCSVYRFIFGAIDRRRNRFILQKKCWWSKLRRHNTHTKPYEIRSLTVSAAASKSKMKMCPNTHTHTIRTPFRMPSIHSPFSLCLSLSRIALFRSSCCCCCCDVVLFVFLISVTTRINKSTRRPKVIQIFIATGERAWPRVRTKWK